MVGRWRPSTGKPTPRPWGCGMAVGRPKHRFPRPGRASDDGDPAALAARRAEAVSTAAAGRAGWHKSRFVTAAPALGPWAWRTGSRPSGFRGVPGPLCSAEGEWPHGERETWPGVGRGLRVSLRSRIQGGCGGGGVATRSGPSWGRRGGPGRLVTVSAQSSRSSGAGAGQEPGAATPMLRGQDRSLRQNGLGARAFSQARREPVIAARRRGEAGEAGGPGRAPLRASSGGHRGHSRSCPAALARLS